MTTDQELDTRIAAFLSAEADTIERQAVPLEAVAEMLAGRLAPPAVARRPREMLLVAVVLLLVASLGLAVAVGSGLLRLPWVETPLDRLLASGTAVTYADGARIVMRDLETGERAALLDTQDGLVVYVAHSPDRAALAILRVGPDHGSSPSLWVMDADGSNLRQLTGELFQGSSLAWSPSGREIAVPTVLGVRIVDVPSADDRLIASPGDVSQVEWHPDSSGLLVFDRPSGAVYAMSTAGRRLSEVFPAEPDVGRSQPGMAVSADGRYVARRSQAGVEVRDLETGRLLEPVADAFQPAFSPDGRWLAVRRDDAIYLRPPDGGRLDERRIGPDGDHSIRSVAFAPDSRQVLLIETPGADEDATSGWLVDIDSGESRRIPWGDWMTPSVSWPGALR